MENPKIRFKGFTKDWEQRKLSEMCGTFEYGLNAAAKEFDGKNKYIRITDIDDASREFLLSDLSSPDICLDGMSKYLLSSGDIVFARTGASVGKTYIYRENDGIVYFAGFLIRAKVNQDNDAEFVFQSTLSPSYEKYIRITSQRSGQPGVNAQEYGEYDLFAPSKEEQQRIGHFLRGIDNLITLHQRKCEQTKNLKKYMLQKMFPQNGAKVPEIRFNGFTHDWEQRKLGDDLVSIHTGTNLLGSITNTGMPLIKMGNIQRGYFDTSKVEFLAENEQPDKADIVNYGDFFFNTRNTLELVGKGATWMKNSGEYAFNSNIARFELRNLDTIFFNYLYNTDYMTKQIHARAMGTTSVAAIYPRTLDSVEYLAPCMKEQQKIGAYFKQLDHLITLHQRQCDELKKMKKYMLQNMFI